jgi:hypothetical protein
MLWLRAYFASLKCELDLDEAIGSRAETRAIIFERPKPEGAGVGPRSGLRFGTTVSVGTRVLASCHRWCLRSGFIL